MFFFLEAWSVVCGLTVKNQDNIVVDQDGIPKIIDFGLSKATIQTNTSADLKGKMSFQWSAPELLQDGSKDHATDVYAYAITIYEVYAVYH